MADEPTKCPRCNGSMEEGHPRTMGGLGWLQVPWNASWLTRLQAGLRPTEVRGLRCKECGYLEYYTKS
jgi:hypothetical protein